MVSRWVLVLLCVYPDDVDNVWVHLGPATYKKHVWNQKYGEQAIHDTGEQSLQNMIKVFRKSLIYKIMNGDHFHLISSYLKILYPLAIHTLYIFRFTGVRDGDRFHLISWFLEILYLLAAHTLYIFRFTGVRDGDLFHLISWYLETLCPLAALEMTILFHVIFYS
jgi:hypothetical protein